MEILKKQLSLESNEYLITHLSLVNVLLPVKLRPKEIEILAIFMSFTGELANNMFSTTGRQLVRVKLNISNAGLANYIMSLKKKGFIKKVEGIYRVYPILHPQKEEQAYQIKLINVG